MSKRRWKRIIDQEPRKGETFIGAGYTYNKGYQFQLCYRDDIDGTYHDLLQEYSLRLFVAQMQLLPKEKRPKWIDQITKSSMKMTDGPDYWMPLPRTDNLEIYEGSPADKILNKEMAAIKDMMLLHSIEDEMNKLND